MLAEAKTRPDITCPRTGAPIPLDKFSVSKWSNELYLVRCPSCDVWHEFNHSHSATKSNP